ncbi:hypothetical protein An03g05640 [Aspergillus niger]|uniref:Uncharacterized protein n=2 Tax=Aspergillus niger TaxID=5061 RepID=A2QH54_ASPNC|nr:hypothetical protein An03g05640 [Aspergillus niger]CAK38324.1 hypothetical protein An03g05640 [Aspergillus niger]
MSQTPHTTQKRKGTFAEDVADKRHMSDTQARTLSALVGWAYTREYPDRNDLQKSDIKCAANHDESAECKVAASILNDIHLYLFCDKYNIPELGSLAVKHMKKTMAGMGDSWIHMSMAFIPAVRLALSKFKESNPLL